MNLSFSFSDGSQPAEKECLVGTASTHVAPNWTVRGFASAYQTRTAAPAQAAGLGAAVRWVGTTSLQLSFSFPFCFFVFLNQSNSACSFKTCFYISVCHSMQYSFFYVFLLPACNNDMYGPDCKLSCKCQNGGVCNRFSGCHCPTGWRGQHCEKSGGCRLISPSYAPFPHLALPLLWNRVHNWYSTKSSSSLPHGTFPLLFFFHPVIFLDYHFLFRQTFTVLLQLASLLFQTGLPRLWNWRVMWSGIWTPAPRSLVRPQGTLCPPTTTLSFASWTALYSR